MILEERNTRTQQMQNMGLELSVVLGKEKTNKAGVVLSLVLYIPDRGNQLIIQLNPASRAVTSGHTEGISPQCLHCQAENKDTKPGCLPPPSQSSAPLPPPSVYSARGWPGSGWKSPQSSTTNKPVPHQINPAHPSWLKLAEGSREAETHRHGSFYLQGQYWDFRGTEPHCPLLSPRKVVH